MSSGGSADILGQEGGGSGAIVPVQQREAPNAPSFCDRALDSSKYSGHSFRSGAATTAVRRGIGDATIQMLGRWKSEVHQAKVSKVLTGKT
jgi:hypothetical protein